MQARTVLNQADFNPRLMEKLETTPDEVVTDMLKFRQYREPCLLPIT